MSETTTLPKKGRRKDDVHKFTKVENNKQICSIDGCNKMYASGTSTTVIKNHIISVHGPSIEVKDKAPISCAYSKKYTTQLSLLFGISFCNKLFTI